MYDQIQGDTLFIILYSVVTAMAMMASCYLLFRRGNAFAPDITLGCSLLSGLRIGSYMVYANHVSLLKRGYQAM